MNRNIAPEIKNISKIKTGFPKSNSGFRNIESQDQVFRLDILFPASGYGVHENKFAALYGMELILSGTNEKNAKSISEELDELGSYVFKNCDYYQSSLTIYGIIEHFENIVKLLKDSYENCIYPLDELTIFKSRKNSELKINLEKTNYLSNREINKMVFGENHPFSESLNEEIIEGLNQEILIEFKTQRLKNPFFIYTGESENIIKGKLIELGYQIPDLPLTHFQDIVPQGTVKIHSEIHKSMSTQSSIRFGKLLPGRFDKDYFKISLFNMILGGYFGSRLMKNIREEKGLTYGIHSSVSPFIEFSYFKISCECNKDLSKTVHEEVINEIVKLQTELIDNEELLTAKNYLSGHLLRSFDGSFNIVERYKTAIESGIMNPDQYYINYFEAIQIITAEELKEIANNYFDIKTLKTCISGEI